MSAAYRVTLAVAVSSHRQPERPIVGSVGISGGTRIPTFLNKNFSGGVGGQ